MLPPQTTTQRLVLAPLAPQDKEALLAILSDDTVGKTYLVPDISTQARKEALATRLTALSRDGGFFMRGIYLQGALIGIIHQTHVENGEVEVGYALSTAATGNGYATEALAAAIDLLFKAGYRVVRAGAFEDNAASMRVMEKCGMTPTGQTEPIDYRGKTHICRYFAIADKG